MKYVVAIFTNRGTEYADQKFNQDTTTDSKKDAYKFNTESEARDWVRKYKHGDKTRIMAVSDCDIKDSEDFYTVAYTKNGVNQIIAVRASSEQEAKQKFMDYMQKKGRKVEFVGITRGKEDKPGMPVIDTCVKDSRKLFTIMANDKIYRVKAKDEACAMKAIKDYGEKDALVDMLNGAIRLIQADNYAQAAKVLGNALTSVNNLAK